MRDYGGDEKTLITVGTHRQTVLKISFFKKIDLNSTAKCLAIPDGTIDESLLILNFVLEAATLLPNIIFIIRFHPVMSFLTAAKRDPRLRSLPSNIQISNSVIDQDFRECRWAIYRGSGAAIRAVCAGIRPLYFKPQGEIFSIDPLFKIGGWRRELESVIQLSDAINHDLNCSVMELEREWLSAYKYCGQYFTDLDIERFSDTVRCKEGVK